MKRYLLHPGQFEPFTVFDIYHTLTSFEIVVCVCACGFLFRWIASLFTKSLSIVVFFCVEYIIFKKREENCVYFTLGICHLLCVCVFSCCILLDPFSILTMFRLCAPCIFISIRKWNILCTGDGEWCVCVYLYEKENPN